MSVSILRANFVSAVVTELERPRCDGGLWEAKGSPRANRGGYILLALDLPVARSSPGRAGTGRIFLSPDSCALRILHGQFLFGAVRKRHGCREGYYRR